MKRTLLLIIAIFLLGATMMAQDTSLVKKKHKIVLGGDGIYLRDSTWKIGGYAGLSLSQTALYQWSPGGTNNFSFLISASAYANYKKGKMVWDNSLDVKWGMVANGLIRSSALAKNNLQKNIDVLQMKSAVGYEISDSKLYLAAKVAFESQFTKSFDYSLTDTSNGRFRRLTVSKFGAPAVLTLGPGLTWKPKDYFTLFFSPIEGKMTFVTKDDPGRDTTTAPDGTFLDRHYSDVDETRFGLKRGSAFMGELGMELDAVFQKDIVKHVNWKSHLNIFVSYMNSNYNTILPQYYSAQDSMGVITINDNTNHIPVIKWDNDFVFKINKFLSAVLSTKFIYQYNAQVPVDVRNNSTGASGADGITDKDKFGNTVTAFKKLQIFEQFGIGLSLKF